MRKLKELRHELRDELLSVWFGVENLDSSGSFILERIIAHQQHNYQRDAEMYRGVWAVFYMGRLLGRVETKPHRKLILCRHHDRFSLYQHMLEQVASEVAPGLQIEFTDGREH